MGKFIVGTLLVGAGFVAGLAVADYLTAGIVRETLRGNHEAKSSWIRDFVPYDDCDETASETDEDAAELS